MSLVFQMAPKLMLAFGVCPYADSSSKVWFASMSRFSRLALSGDSTMMTNSSPPIRYTSCRRVCIIHNKIDTVNISEARKNKAIADPSLTVYRASFDGRCDPVSTHVGRA